VALETTTSSSPGVFKLIDSDDYIHVVMPMFVQW
jgi:DNA polymerase-3 subunit beta